MRSTTCEVIAERPRRPKIRCMALPPSDLRQTLQHVRKARRLSQLELSFRLGVSQRHVSFVESGRARPSRDLLLAWLHELDAPLVLRNEVLLLAGYAPAFTASALDAPALEAATGALDALLEAHDPMPAFVIDADWQLVRINRGGVWLAAQLGLSLDAKSALAVNMLDLFAHPDGFTRAMLNLREVGPMLLAHLRRDALARPSLQPRVDAVEARVSTVLGAAHGVMPRTPTAPVLTARYATAFGPLAFFSLFTTFGTPQDITLASLRLEHLCAADAHTRAVMQREVHV
jgi:transcriptional regulator with XRE-family HTH domain